MASDRCEVLCVGNMSRGRRGVDVASLDPRARSASVGGDSDVGGIETLAVLNRYNEVLDSGLAESFYLSRQVYLQFWSDVSRDPAKFLAHLVLRLCRIEKTISKGRRPEAAVLAMASAQQQLPAVALQRCHNAVLSTLYFVSLHFDYHIHTASGDDNLHSAMQQWRKQSKHEAFSSDFAREVYLFVQEKGGRLAGDDGMSFTDQLESAVHIESIHGLAIPFTMPAQVTQVAPPLAARLWICFVCLCARSQDCG